MPAPTKYPYSLRTYSDLYGIPLHVLKRLSAKDINIDDEVAVRSELGLKTPLIIEATTQPSVNPQKTTETNGPDIEAGLHGNIISLREAERLLASAYKSIVLVDVIKARAIRQEWLAVSEALRKAESSAPDILKASKTLIPFAEVKLVFYKIHSAISDALNSLPDRCAAKLVGLDANQIREQLKKETDLVRSEILKWEKKDEASQKDTLSATGN